MIRETYKDIEIRYHENSNDWVFEAKNRERSYASLLHAKRAIDDLPPDKKKVERFDAYLVNSLASSIKLVSVGAYVPRKPGSYSSEGFWVTCDGQRGKESPQTLIKVTPTNDALVAEANALTVEIRRLNKERAAKIAEMERIGIPKDE